MERMPDSKGAVERFLQVTPAQVSSTTVIATVGQVPGLSAASSAVSLEPHTRLGSHHCLLDVADKLVLKSSSECVWNSFACMCIDTGFSGNVSCPKRAGWHFALNKQDTASIYVNLIQYSCAFMIKCYFL